MKPVLTTLLLLSAVFLPKARSQQAYAFETRDIANFWEAFDQLRYAESTTDSVQIIQQTYIDRASRCFRKFLRLRGFTAEEYVAKISAYPKFWHSVRPLTEGISHQKPRIDSVFRTFRQSLPGFRQPDLCFAIGCLRTGGTTTSSLILIGAEIAASDSTVDPSELTPWLKSIVGHTGGIVAMVAHECIHIQQARHKLGSLGKQRLLRQCIKEGAADFLCVLLLGLNINAPIHQYGLAHEAELIRQFQTDLQTTPNDYSNWLYNGGRATEVPADLGYFIGYRIAEAYYNKMANKKVAIKHLLNPGKYIKIYRKSGYLQ